MITLTSTRSIKASAIARFVFCAIILFLLFRYSDETVGNMKKGLTICAEVLVPTLFPYMVISEILVRSNLGYYAERVFGKPMQLIFGVSGACAGALILGIICGFPVGAKATAALYEKGDISKRDAEALMTFCNYPSAPFMIFAVGESMLGSRKIGIFLYLNILLTGSICGALRNRRSRDLVQVKENRSHSVKSAGFIKTFTDSVSSAAGSVITVCAYVAFFTCITGSLSALLGGSGPSLQKALIFSLFELTAGSAECAALGTSGISVIMCSAAAGWSGLSVFMQIYSLSRNGRDDISLAPYLRSKVICSIICAAVTALSIRFFPALIPSKESAEDVFLPTFCFPAAFTTAVNMLFILTVLIYVYKKLDRRLKI